MPYLQAWEATTGAVRPRKTRGDARHWGRWLSLTAAVSLVAITVTFFAVRPVGERDIIGSLARTSDGGMERTQGLIWHRVLRVGEPLRVGDTLTVRSPALVALAEGGTLRLAANSVIDVEAASQLSLERGKLYVDEPGGVNASHPLRVATRLGLVEHVGTQFEVLERRSSSAYSGSGGTDPFFRRHRRIEPPQPVQNF